MRDWLVSFLPIVPAAEVNGAFVYGVPIHAIIPAESRHAARKVAQDRIEENRGRKRTEYAVVVEPLASVERIGS